MKPAMDVLELPAAPLVAPLAAPLVATPRALPRPVMRAVIGAPVGAPGRVDAGATGPVIDADSSFLADLYELTKPRMNFLVVITTLVGYLVGQRVAHAQTGG